MSEDRLKSYLRKRLGEYRHPVDDSLWLSIKQHHLPKRKKLRLTLVMSGIGAAVIILFLMLFNRPESIEPKPTIVSNENTQTDIHSEDVEPIAFDDNKEIELYQPIIEQDVTILETPKKVYDNEAQNEFKVTEDGQENVLGISREEKIEPEAETFNETPSDVKNMNLRGVYPALPEKQKKNRKLCVSLAVNGSGSLNNIVYGPSDATSANPDPIEIENLTYDFPISFAITIRKGISNGFSLESGVTYTYLRTKDNLNSIDIRMHYLGVPIKGIYTIYGNKRVSFYTAAGGMVERQIAGKLKLSGEWENLSNSNLQWSVGASAGVNLKLGASVGLFAEPGIVYYFDDGSSIPTIRKDRPFNFNFQFGLRFNIE